MTFYSHQPDRLQPRAFTLVETLVAVAILTIAMVGPYTVAKHSIDAADIARDELAASNLAQEGLEYVRSVRDGNYLYNISNPGSQRSWLYGLDSTGGSANCFAGTCTVEPTQSVPTLALVACGGTCAPLYLTGSGQYTQVQSGNTPTYFTRSIQIAAVPAGAPNPTEITITSTVTWVNKGASHTVQVSEDITDWL